jgi:hypothetical protein
MDAEGRVLGREHEGARRRAETPLEKQNKKWLATETNVIGGGKDGKGTQGLTDAARATAKQLGAK